MRRETLPRIGFSAVLSAALLACATSCSPEARMARAEKTDISAAKNREDAARYVYENELARTPPMGWNSWNAFRGNISEEQMKGIVDAMVTSGLREAGYTYWVIDDGWMANKCATEGRLVAGPNKFPGGMRNLSDYVHGRGLKFGLYEDRGHSTCMKLPGSFRHEQADMDTFAEWDVDYIKLDSCYAEINDRKSSDDFGLFEECIMKTGRPMILSMANYTDPSWAWGGQDIGHLWRTS